MAILSSSKLCLVNLAVVTLVEIKYWSKLERVPRVKARSRFAICTGVLSLCLFGVQREREREIDVKRNGYKIFVNEKLTKYLY